MKVITGADAKSGKPKDTYGKRSGPKVAHGDFVSKKGRGKAQTKDAGPRKGKG